MENNCKTLAQVTGMLHNSFMEIPTSLPPPSILFCIHTEVAAPLRHMGVSRKIPLDVLSALSSPWKEELLLQSKS